MITNLKPEQISRTFDFNNREDEVECFLFLLYYSGLEWKEYNTLSEADKQKYYDFMILTLLRMEKGGKNGNN